MRRIKGNGDIGKAMISD